MRNVSAFEMNIPIRSTPMVDMVEIVASRGLGCSSGAVGKTGGLSASSTTVEVGLVGESKGVCSDGGAALMIGSRYKEASAKKEQQRGKDLTEHCTCKEHSRDALKVARQNCCLMYIKAVRGRRKIMTKV